MLPQSTSLRLTFIVDATRQTQSEDRQNLNCFSKWREDLIQRPATGATTHHRRGDRCGWTPLKRVEDWLARSSRSHKWQSQLREASRGRQQVTTIFMAGQVTQSLLLRLHLPHFIKEKRWQRRDHLRPCSDASAAAFLKANSIMTRRFGTENKKQQNRKCD